MQKDVESVCEQLDEKLLEYFDILGQLYQEQSKLNQYMRDGFLNLSRARYTMGVKSVSALQFPDEMKSLIGSEINSETKDKEIMFNTWRNSVTKHQPKDQDARKRNVKSEIVETVGGSEEKDGSDAQSIVDPIRFFGVLVPQTLKRSQSSFQEAVDMASTVANLKNRLENVRENYKYLLLRKDVLVKSLE